MIKFLRFDIFVELLNRLVVLGHLIQVLKKILALVWIGLTLFLLCKSLHKSTSFTFCLARELMVCLVARKKYM